MCKKLLFYSFLHIFLGLGKIVWNGQTEPKGDPKAYKDTSRVRFAHSKKAYNKREISLKAIFLYPFKKLLQKP